MTTQDKPLYVARINRGGALLADTRRFLQAWDDALDLEGNAKRAIEENLLAKGSRKQAREVISNLSWRYLEDPQVRAGLVALARSAAPAEVLDRVLFYLAAKGDPVIYDGVVEYVQPRFASGFTEVTQAGTMEQLREWVAEGRSRARWNDETTERVAQGLLSTLRDFGLLDGSKTRRITPPYLPDEAFALVAFLVHRRTGSGEKTLADPDWRLFFLDRPAVERFFVEASLRHYLSYASAADVVRISFPADNFDGEVGVVVA